MVGGGNGRALAKKSCHSISSDEQRDTGEFGRCMAVSAVGFKPRWKARGHPSGPGIPAAR